MLACEQHQCLSHRRSSHSSSAWCRIIFLVMLYSWEINWNLASAIILTNLRRPSISASTVQSRRNCWFASYLRQNYSQEKYYDVFARIVSIPAGYWVPASHVGDIAILNGSDSLELAVIPDRLLRGKIQVDCEEISSGCSPLKYVLFVVLIRCRPLQFWQRLPHSSWTTALDLPQLYAWTWNPDW